MSHLAADERAALSDLAERLGPDAPTLCEGWDSEDLVVHLLVREGSPAGIGIAVPLLARVAERVSARTAETEYGALVERLRGGPPRLSPFALPGVDALANGLEMFVHHEDLRRAQPDWAPRSLPVRTQDDLWRSLRVPGRLLLRRAGVPVIAERADTGEQLTLKGGQDGVVVRGLPSEVVLFCFGRGEHAQVDLQGSDSAVATLRGASLGF